MSKDLETRVGFLAPKINTVQHNTDSGKIGKIVTIFVLSQCSLHLSLTFGNVALELTTLELTIDY